MLASSTSAFLDVCIRIYEYMCRFLILFTHYLFHDDEFMNFRNKSLNSWLNQLFLMYTIAINIRFPFSGVSSIDQFDALQNCGEFCGYYALFYNAVRLSFGGHVGFHVSTYRRMEASNIVTKCAVLLEAASTHLPPHIAARNKRRFLAVMRLIEVTEVFPR